MNEFGTLIKFGRNEHLLQLQQEGLLYLNPLTYFWEIEDQELRGDSFDSVAEVARGQRVVMPLPDGNDFSMEGNWIYKKYPPEPEKINIFCMYALRPFSGSFPVDERNFQFGEHAIVFINRPEFMNRIESSLKSQNIAYKADLVEYIDDEHTGEIGPFKKRMRFAYQSEWRLVCYAGPGEPRVISIGSIQDISVIISSDEVNKQIRIDSEQNTPPDSAEPRR